MLRACHTHNVASVLAVALSCFSIGSVARAEPLDPHKLELDYRTARDHELWVERLARDNERNYQQYLGAYDRYLASNPGDADAAIARCRFIEWARFDEDVDEYNVNADVFLECVEDLEERFPNKPAVVLMGLESLWGEAAIEQTRSLIESGLEGWENADIALVYQRLAISTQFDDVAEAMNAANKAMSFDPSLDLTLIVARFWQDRGDNHNAIRALEPHLDTPADPWVLQQKATLLVELGGYEQAVRLYSQLVEDAEYTPDSLGYAKALEGAGDFHRARDRYAAAAEEHWDEYEAHRRLFFFDLEHREAHAAAASYERYRDLGFDADPVLRYRLDLAWKHPGARWHWRDVWGALLLVGIAFGVLVGPALWILPIHYFTLLREVRGTGTPPTESPWGLRHCWYVTAWILLVECLAAYLFYYDEFMDLVVGPSALSAPDSVRLARITLVTLAITVVGLLPILRPRDFRLLVRTRWSVLRTILVAITAMVALRIGVLLPIHLIAGEFESLGTTLDGVLPFADTVLGKIIHAIGATYGTAVQIGYVVVFVPLWEELVFRGILLRGYGRHVPFAVANTIQATLFTVAHESVMLFPMYFALGATAGILARRSGGLAAPILLHASNNALALVALRILNL